jgi:putative membrane protein
MNLMMWDGNGMGLWGWGFGALIVIGVIVLVIVVVRLATNRTSSPPTSLAPQAVSNDVGRILDERYAKGELTTEEYRERKSALGLDKT